MHPDTPPRHGLFLKWGRLQVGASGIPALMLVAFTIAMAFAGRLLGAW
jgi:hypothetical protein